MLAQLGRRVCSSVASRLEIPRHLVNVTHSRSSGSGGQNVNKVATKVTLRVAVADAAPFLPEPVLERLREQQQHRITKSGELVLQCDEERTQARNQSRAFERLQALVDQATFEPEEFIRRQDTETPERVQRVRKQQKQQHSSKKSARRKNFDG
jgi:ribosome-associated protein